MKSAALLAALGAALDKRFNDATAPPVGGVAGPVQYRPGLLVPALDWHDCSMLWITAGRRWRSSTFPALSETQTCSGALILEATVGVARCSTAFGDVNGHPPGLDTLAAEMDAQEDDKDRLEAAVCGAMAGMKRDLLITQWSRGPVETQGPEGATVAVYLTLLAEMTPAGLAGAR